ncbi:MAG: hypothetical protein ACLP8A_10730 [Methylovirgula sp.]
MGHSLGQWLNDDIAIMLGTAAVIAVFILWSVVGLRLLYDYRINGEAIEVRLFHRLPICRVPIADISEVSKTSWRQLGMDTVALRFGNRVFGPCVLIQKSKGKFRRVVITPADADAFIDAVKAER